MFNTLTVWIGLNKEMIEETGIHFGYEYDVNKIIKDKLNNMIKKMFPYRYIKENKYDSWLNVIEYNMLNNDLIFNVRNGILHSEFEPSSRNKLIYNIQNSNYTGFKAEILWPAFYEFITFYFGNANIKNMVSLKPEWAVIGVDDLKNIKQLNNEDDLKKFLNIANAGIIKRQYNKKKKVSNTSEHIINIHTRSDGTINGNGELFNKSRLNEEEKEMITVFINKRIKNFYQYDLKKQLRYICSIYNFFVFPRHSISNWMLYFSSLDVDNFDEESKFMSYGTGIDKMAALFPKLGFILYRMQYKKFEEIDYNLVNIDLSKIRYQEEGDINGVSPYTHAYNKIKVKNSSYTDSEIKTQIVCEIIRDAMSHGRVKPCLDASSGDLSVVFIDSYKGKKREITLSVDELKDFVMSEAFDASKCIVKDSSDIKHK